MKKAVILVSGGMDSAVVLAIAREQGFAVHALSVSYGQRHTSELDAAVRVARDIGAIEHKTVNVDLRSIGGSALTARSEEHTSELQSLMRISYAVFCLKKKKLKQENHKEKKKKKQ